MELWERLNTHGALLEWKNPSDFHRWCLFQWVLHVLLHAILGIGIFGFRYLKKIDIRCKAKLIIIKSIKRQNEKIYFNFLYML
jgi:hypothetical protein